jgi:hypothetical protein
MVTVTSSQLSPHSGPTSAVAVVQTSETKGLCIIVVLSTMQIASKKFATLYVNVDFAEGNVEQTLALKRCPVDCKVALAQLLSAQGFRTAVIGPIVEKVLEAQSASRTKF